MRGDGTRHGAGAGRHPWASLRCPGRKGTPCPAKPPRRSTGSAETRSTSSSSITSAASATSGSRSRRRTSPRPSGSASSSAKTSACWKTSAGSQSDGRESVDLTMPPHDLMELLRRLHGEAECVLEGSACARLLREGRRERQAALPASQERLRGADRATRPAQGLTDGRARRAASRGSRRRPQGGTEVRCWAFVPASALGKPQPPICFVGPGESAGRPIRRPGGPPRRRRSAEPRRG